MISNLKNPINNKLGMLFPPAMRAAGYLFLFIGVYFLSYSIYLKFWPFALVALAPFLIGFFIAITSHGILIDVEQKRYKKYTNILGYQQGSWKKWNNYPFISILQNQVSTMAFSSSNRAATTSRNLYFDICLLDKTHRHKLLIKRLNDQNIAIDDAQELAKMMNVQLTRYKPVISMSTQSRRKRR